MPPCVLLGPCADNFAPSCCAPTLPSSHKSRLQHRACNAQNRSVAQGEVMCTFSGFQSCSSTDASELRASSTGITPVVFLALHWLDFDAGERYARRSTWAGSKSYRRCQSLTCFTRHASALQILAAETTPVTFDEEEQDCQSFLPFNYLLYQDILNVDFRLYVLYVLQEGRSTSVPQVEQRYFSVAALAILGYLPPLICELGISRAAWQRAVDGGVRAAVWVGRGSVKHD